MLSGLLKSPRAQHTVHRILEALVNAPAHFTKPKVGEHETDLGFRTKKEGPAPDVGQEEFTVGVHGQPDAAQHITQGRERALSGDVPEGEPAMPEVLKAVVLVVAVEAIDRALEKEESRVRGKREDKRKGGPAVLALEPKAECLRRLGTISMKNLVVGGVGFS